LKDRSALQENIDSFFAAPLCLNKVCSDFSSRRLKSVNGSAYKVMAKVKLNLETALEAKALVFDGVVDTHRGGTESKNLPVTHESETITTMVVYAGAQTSVGTMVLHGSCDLIATQAESEVLVLAGDNLIQEL
jgi:hypothetical protein